MGKVNIIQKSVLRRSTSDIAAKPISKQIESNYDYGVYTMQKYATPSKDELAAVLESDEYCLQLKEDGASYILAKDLDDTVHLYKDNISKKTGELIDKIELVPHLARFAEKVLPTGSQLLVEICYNYEWPTRERKEISSSPLVNGIMLCNPDKAIWRQGETENVRAYIFDILFWNEERFHEKDFADRYDFLDQLAWDIFEDYGPNHSFVTDITFAKAWIKDKAALLSEWLQKGMEGGVIKKLHSGSSASANHHLRQIGQTAARPKNAYKVKQLATLDVVIMSIEYPSKEYLGKDPESYPYRDSDDNPVNRLWYLGYANSFTIGAYNDKGQLVKIGTVASGLTDLDRQNMAEYPMDYIGSVVELTCMSLDNEAHTLRHPRLLRFRGFEDKAPESCRLADIFK